MDKQGTYIKDITEDQTWSRNMGEIEVLVSDKEAKEETKPKENNE